MPRPRPLPAENAAPPRRRMHPRRRCAIHGSIDHVQLQEYPVQPTHGAIGLGLRRVPVRVEFVRRREPRGLEEGTEHPPVGSVILRPRSALTIVVVLGVGDARVEGHGEGEYSMMTAAPAAVTTAMRMMPRKPPPRLRDHDPRLPASGTIEIDIPRGRNNDDGRPFVVDATLWIPFPPRLLFVRFEPIEISSLVNVGWRK